MRQPIDENMLPHPRVIESNRTYRFPFTFVVPSQLLPAACGHDCTSEQVKESHLRIPPSLGDASVSGTGQVLLDDFAPEMAKVVYLIRAKLVRVSDGNGDDDGPQERKETVVCDSTRKIRIVPTVEEDPPLQIDDDDDDGEYRLRHRKDLRKGLFKGRLGSLMMEGLQPKSIHLSSVTGEPGRGRGKGNSGSTLATITVRFDPAKNKNGQHNDNEDSNSISSSEDEEQQNEDQRSMPRLDTLTTRLKVSTYFSTVPSQSFRGSTPSSKKHLQQLQVEQGSYSETIHLSSRNIESSIRWERHHHDHQRDQDQAQDRTSPPPSYSSSSASSDSEHSVQTENDVLSARTTENNLKNKNKTRGKKFYTAKIPIPVILPTTQKSFPPTFHSCFVSRVYTLEVALSVSSPGAGTASQIMGMGSTKLGLRIPLQIVSSGGMTNSTGRVPSRETSLVGLDVGDDRTRSVDDETREDQEQEEEDEDQDDEEEEDRESTTDDDVDTDRGERTISRIMSNEDSIEVETGGQRGGRGTRRVSQQQQQQQQRERRQQQPEAPSSPPGYSASILFSGRRRTRATKKNQELECYS